MWCFGMIFINKDELNVLDKYLNVEKLNHEVIDSLVDELTFTLERASGFEGVIYQDIEDENFYRIYFGSSVVEVYLDEDKLCIDFDDTWCLDNNIISYNAVDGEFV